MTLFKYESKYCVKPFRDLYIKQNGMVIVYPSEEQIKALGYKPLVETECDLEYNHDTHIAVATYQERANDIVQGWEIQESELWI